MISDVAIFIKLNKFCFSVQNWFLLYFEVV